MFSHFYQIGHRSASISCSPLIAPNASQPYSETEAEYDRTYCLEHLVDFSSVVTNQLASFPSNISVHGHGTFLYQRYFPYILGVQAAICAGPVVFWKLYGSETLTYAVNYVTGKMGSKTKQGGEEKEVVEKDDSSKPDEKTQAVSSELKTQITSWWNQSSLAKRYIIKLVFHEVTFIFVIFFYLGFDELNIENIKYKFLCFVDKKEFVRCNFAGVAILRAAWYTNLVLVVVAFVINTFQMIDTLCCASSSKEKSQSFLNSWHLVAGKTEKCCKGLLNDAQLIAAVCRANISKFRSSSTVTES